MLNISSVCSPGATGPETTADGRGTQASVDANRNPKRDKQLRVVLLVETLQQRLPLAAMLQ